MLDANNPYYRALVCIPPKTRDMLKIFAFYGKQEISSLHVMHVISLKMGLTDSMLHCLKQKIFTIKGVGLLMPAELQEHLRDSLSFAESAKCLAKALHALLSEFPPNLAENPDRWGYLQSLAPHAISVCGYAEQFDLPAESVANLLAQTALLLYLTEQYALAEPIIRKILQIAQADSDQPNPHSAYWLKLLAGVLEKTGRAEQAIPLLQKADQINKLFNS
jgi:tetratricopeptide (TPR) repeat protein